MLIDLTKDWKLLDSKNVIETNLPTFYKFETSKIWTNNLIFKFLKFYPDKLHEKEKPVVDFFTESYKLLDTIIESREGFFISYSEHKEKVIESLLNVVENDYFYILEVP